MLFTFRILVPPEYFLNYNILSGKKIVSYIIVRNIFPQTAYKEVGLETTLPYMLCTNTLI